MKTKEELNALRNEIEALNEKLAELSEEELKQVGGGDGLGTDNNDGIYCGTNASKPTIIIPKGVTFDVEDPGKNEKGSAGGDASVLVPEESGLIIVGKGSLKA